MQADEDDFLAALGPLALGSRLKRLADRLYRDVSTSLEPLHPGLAPNHVPLLACLDRFGPQRITDLTRRLGVSQPGVTRMVTALAALDVVAVEKAAKDQRQSLVRLTPAGEGLVTAMRADYWPRVDAAAESLFKGAEGDLMRQIAAVERALDQRPLSARIADAAEAAG